MNVKVLFFGATAEAAGKRDVEMSFGPDTTAQKAFAQIINSYPNLPEKLLFAINQEYSKGDEVIKDGDELAVFTAVSGG